VNTIAKWLRPQDIRLDVEITDKRALFDLVAQHVEHEVGLAAHFIAHCLARREQAGSTAIGHGVAIPHARIEGLHETHALYLRLKQPLVFNAPDHQPVADVLVLLVPHPAAQDHLELLADATRIFANPDLRQRLHASRDAEEIASLLTD
jgi:PTS system nitrogen regulatory IIA component